MSAERHQKVVELFLAASELESCARAAHLDRECGDDVALRAEVEAMLACDPGEEATTRDRIERIGPYRIQEVLGEGGMGIVYLAMQTSSVRRQVALKVIKSGKDSKQVLARFEIERDALGMMNHVGLAKVFDAGTSEDGRPFFAMEYVPGIPITEYCDKHELSVKQRLALFAQVCEAVQHAHQKGVIHRDIKPSNILVMEQQDIPVPKIIDFGVAKAIFRNVSNATLLTVDGQWIGTPEYMSPEQADPSRLDVDTRADIYSLGVLLYELLTGSLPFESAALRETPVGARRIICEVEPPKPSTRLSGLMAIAGEVRRTPAESVTPHCRVDTPRETVNRIAQHRRTDPKTLVKQIRGDLDWITTKAMAKERARRYASSTELASDIGRYLRNEPVLAGPPNAAYLMRKFARRHKSGVLAGSMMVLALTVGLSVAVAAYVRAEREATKSLALSNLVMYVFEGLFPDGDWKGTVDFLRVLSGSEEKIRLLPDETEQKTLLLARVGDAWRKLGHLEKASALVADTVRLQSRLSTTRSATTVNSLATLGELLFRTGKHQEGEAFLVEALTRARELGEDGKDQVARTLNRFGLLLQNRGAHVDAERYFREALEIRRRLPREYQWSVVETLNNLAMTLTHTGRIDEASNVFGEAIAISLELPEIQRQGMEGDDALYRMATVMGNRLPPTANLGGVLTNVGGYFADQKSDYAKAATLFEAALEVRREVFGNDSRDVAEALNNLATAWERSGNAAKAVALLRESLAIKRRIGAEGGLGVAIALSNLANVLRQVGGLEEAENMARESLNLFKVKAPRDWRNHVVSDVLGAVLLTQRRFGEAEVFLLNAQTGLAECADCPLLFKREVLEHLVELYVGWEEAEPGQGNSAKASKWRSALAECQPPSKVRGPGDN